MPNPAASTPSSSSASGHSASCILLAAMAAGDWRVGGSGVHGMASCASKNSVPSESAGESRVVVLFELLLSGIAAEKPARIDSSVVSSTSPR